MGMQESTPSAGLNEALVLGEFVGTPECRELPSGAVAASFSVTVRKLGAKTTSVPVVWYDPPERLHRWVAGEWVVVAGSVVRRYYQTGVGVGSSTEVVVDNAHLLRHSTRSAALIQASIGSLQSVIRRRPDR